jgi:GTP-binding protein
VRGEVASFDPEIAERPALVVLNKLDLVTAAEAAEQARALKARTGLEVLVVSAEERIGLEPLLAAIARRLKEGETASAECHS